MSRRRRRSDLVLSKLLKRPAARVGDRTRRQRKLVEPPLAAPKPAFGDQAIDDARVLVRGDQARDHVAMLRHLERFPLFHPAQVNAEILPKLSHTDPVVSIHATECSTM